MSFFLQIFYFQFSFEKQFDAENLVSLMYYLGLLTIEQKQYSSYIFKIPNFVIQSLYFEYFTELLQKRDNIHIESDRVKPAVLSLPV